MKDMNELLLGLLGILLTLLGMALVGTFFAIPIATAIITVNWLVGLFG